MKLRDVIKLSELSGFRLISGKGGLDKEVNACEIIDFEFADGISFAREEMFYGNSLGLTSLMFARYDASMILPAVKKLDHMGVACLCYKPVFFKTLPDEVIKYSESHGFPIFEIVDDAFFEDIVLAVKKEAGLDMTEKEMEEVFCKVTKKKAEDREVERLKHMTLTGKGRYLQAACFESASYAEGDDPFDRDHMVRYMRRLSLDERYSDKVSVARFGKGGIAFLMRDEERSSDMEILFKDACIASGLPIERAVTGMSDVLSEEEFAKAIREAFWALRVAKLEKNELVKFGKMGIYRVIASEMYSEDFVRGAEEFAAPLLKDDEDMKILMQTAKEYVLSGMDLNLTSEKLFCHKNTVRYRLSRIRELLGGELEIGELKEALALSVRVLLLEGKI